jgi:hypothetical protein
MSFLFRPHRGLLADAMEEVVELNDKAALVSHIKNGWKKHFPDHGYDFNQDTIKVKAYCFDDRIDWDTHIVTYEKGGHIHVEGFTNGPV